MNSNLLRDLPRVDDLLSALISRPDTIKLPRVALLDSIRITLDDIRNTIKSGNANTMPNFNNICDLIADHALKSRKSGILPVINATGVVLHTNLGRAPIGENIAKQTIEAAAGYCALELDLETGQRGQRGSFCEDLLIRLTGCESALVVNNNAAAVLLALSAICAGRQIICSRGELVEIGGSFRIPEIITQGGVRLVEIGTTNRT
ncbi:MAG: L-seryl-tRNA(Sec) selenium transferase, partial [Defluviitaleaceae bacterium]|nr:L-seryl-tRNA(Sec) selenium transferase [Defluviitaleaceae bacterium]